MQTVTLVFEREEEGGYSAFVAEIPGVNSQGESLDEAREMVLEALQELLTYRREKALALRGAVVEQIAVAT